MSRFNRCSTRTLGCVAFVAAYSSVAYCQEMRDVHPEKRTQVLTSATIRRPAWFSFPKSVPFQPFKYELPPGHPVDPNSKIKLPNGSMVTVRDYIDSLNRIEKGLAEVGHSMRTGSGHVVGTKWGDDALFARQVSAYHNSIAGKFTSSAPRQPSSGIDGNTTARDKAGTVFKGTRNRVGSSGGTLRDHLGSGGNLDRDLINPPNLEKPIQPLNTGRNNGGQGQSHQYGMFGASTSERDDSYIRDELRLIGGTGEYFNQGFSGGFGDSNFGANISAHLKITGSSSAKSAQFQEMISEMRATADMQAGAQIMGNTFPLLQFNADCMGSDKTNTRSYDLGLYVGGVQIFHDHDSANGPALNWQDGFSINWDAQSPTFVFPLFGPFEMKGFVGVKGGAGITGAFRVRSFSVDGEITPFVTASAYGQITAGVDLGVASADVGVAANLVLLDDHMNFKLDAGVAWDPTNHFSAVQDCALTNDLTTMSGSFSLVAHVYGPWGFKLYDWSTELAGWPGESSHLEFIKPAKLKLDWH